MTHLIRIAEKVVNRPLMVEPGKLAIIASILDGRIGIDASELKELAPESSRFVGTREKDADGKKKAYRTQDGVAIIEISGSLVNRYSFLDALSGMTSYEEIKHLVGMAASDPDVSGILLDIDSPGGEAIGAFEAADAVRAAAAQKPVTAVVNGMAASAAYAIASAATRIVSTASGISGSIGVVLLHTDYSNKLHQAGVKPTLIHAGARKVDGNPYQPLTDDVRGELKAEVERFYDLFVESVAAGRPITAEAIRATEARTFLGVDAVKNGLADSVGSFETALSDLTRVRSAPRSQKGLIMTTYTQEQLDAEIGKAKTEAHAAGKADGLTAGKAEGHKVGLAEGAAAERERIGAILGSEGAKKNATLAHKLALTTDMTAEAAGLLMADLKPEATGSRLDVAMAGQDPKVDTTDTGVVKADVIGAGLDAAVEKLVAARAR